MSGCVQVATTGAEVVYNRQSIQKSLTDHYLALKTYHALYLQTTEFRDTHVAISVYHRDVLLTGQTPKVWQKNKITKIVKNIPNVKTVYNLIHIQAPSSNLTRMSDAWITAKIKAKMLASNDLDATQIKVITENGIVYLMGILPVDQANEAIQIARNTDGVLSVVKLFYYMKISKKPE